MSAPARLWTCPFCGRRVPSHVATCYCGSERPVEAPPAPPRAKPRLAIAAAAVAVVGAISITWVLMHRTSSAPAAAHAAAPDTIVPPPPTDPAVTAPVPDDVTTSARAAVVLVESSAGRGTGFFSAADVVTTTTDVVGRGKSAIVTLSDGRRLDATVTAIADQARLVQLRVGTPAKSWLPPSPLRDARGDESVAQLTWPETTARGVVKALWRQQGVDVIDTTLIVHVEDDGAAVIDYTGRALGVVAGRRIVSFDSARPYFRAVP